MVTSLLFALAALAAPSSDSAFDSFDQSANPAQGTLGAWSYGYFGTGGAFTRLPHMIPNPLFNVYQWQVQTGVGVGIPRVLKNHGLAQKKYAGVVVPTSDFLLLKPKTRNAAVVRFTADATANYTFDVTFKPMGTKRASSTRVSVQKAGATQGGCAGKVSGLYDAGGALDCPTVSVLLVAGESVDFVVDADGAGATYDDIGLRVDVQRSSGGDTDGDGLADDVEDVLGTSSADDDSDDDTLLDGEEVDVHGTDPLSDDTDQDGLLDPDEILVHLTDPLSDDTDLDNLSDADELVEGTDPLDEDTDDDGLLDGDEIDVHATDPLVADTDGDGLSDGAEVAIHGSDPNDGDSDDDGLTDAAEVALGTDPARADSDGDGLLDADEQAGGTDPADPDTDDDGLWDGAELADHGTDPLDADSDDGTTSDGQEVASGRDPLDPVDDISNRLEEEFDGSNPSDAALGQWTYGSYGANDAFEPLTVRVDDPTLKLQTWQYDASAGSVPRITHNTRSSDKTWNSVLYPADDFLVVRPGAGRPAVIRYTAEEDGDYWLDVTFKSMRTQKGASVWVSVERDGVAVDSCEGSVSGLVSSPSFNEIHCEDAAVSLYAGEVVDFVVSSNGADLYDEIGVQVEVTAALDTGASLSSCGLTPHIGGRIWDADHNPVPGITLSASNSNGSSSSVTDASGNFSFSVPPGAVDVDICVPGTWWSILQDPNDQPNPDIPGLVRCVTGKTWTCNDGDLRFVLPAPSPVTVSVTSGGQPVSGAQIQLAANLTSDPFNLLPNVSRTVAFAPNGWDWTWWTAGPSGALDFPFYPSTGQTFDVTVRKAVDGVTFSKTVTDISPSVSEVQVELSVDTQLLTGSLLDTEGAPVPGLSLYADGTDAFSTVVTDADGEFSFQAPAGELDVGICVRGAWWSILQEEDNQLNPDIPGLVHCVDPISWTSSDGPLELVMPESYPITVTVLDSDGNPLSGAKVQLPTTLTSDPFELVPGVSRTVAFAPNGWNWIWWTTGPSGTFDYMFYPSTGQTFDVTATYVDQGVTLTRTLTGLDPSDPSVEIQLPPGPQLLTGSIVDADGAPVPALSLYATNADGSGSSVSDASGEFSFYVPAGQVDVGICVPGAWWSILQEEGNQPNPDIPGLVRCVDPISWTSSDGPLELVMPESYPITVTAIDNDGNPLSGAKVQLPTTLTSDPFELVPGVSRTVGFAPNGWDWTWWTTGPSGAFDYMFYPSTDQTFDVTATAVVNGVTLTGELLNAPAIEGGSYQVVIPGRIDLGG